jgi:hypothetical protein
MNKRYLLAGLGALPFLALSAKAGEAKTGTYTVPKNVKKIRVRSTVGDKEVLDTNFRVVPGQKFIIDAIEE